MYILPREALPLGFGETILRIMGALAALALVLFLAWFTLRWLGTRMGGTPGGSNRLLHILDRVSFGKNSSLLLVRVQQKVYFMAVSEHAIEKIGEFDDPEGLIQTPSPTEVLPFSDTMKQAMQKLKKPKGPGGPGGDA